MNNPSVPGSQPAPCQHRMAISRLADKQEGWREIPGGPHIYNKCKVKS